MIFVKNRKNWLICAYLISIYRVPTLFQYVECLLYYNLPSNLLKLDRNNLSRLVQFLTGHNKLKRHKNIQDGITDPHSCRLCLEDEESLFHVIAECPAMQTHRSGVFKLPTPTTFPNPPDWTVNQVEKFLKVSPVGEMLDQDG